MKAMTDRSDWRAEPDDSITMIARFQKHRWSKLRTEIHEMKPGEKRVFSPNCYNSAHATVDRLNDAYDGMRKWKLSRKNFLITVKCVKK